MRGNLRMYFGSRKMIREGLLKRGNLCMYFLAAGEERMLEGSLGPERRGGELDWGG